MEFNTRDLTHSCCPVVLQIDDALLLAFGADDFVKIDSLSDALLIGKLRVPVLQACEYLYYEDLHSR